MDDHGDEPVVSIIGINHAAPDGVRRRKRRSTYDEPVFFIRRMRHSATQVALHPASILNDIPQRLFYRASENTDTRRLILCFEGFKRIPGEENGKLASLSQSGARPDHASPVRFDEGANQRKSDAEPRLGAQCGSIRLPEQIEYVRQDFGRDTDSGVSYANDGLIVSRMHLYRQLSARVRVSRRVGE